MLAITSAACSAASPVSSGLQGCEGCEDPGRFEIESVMAFSGFRPVPANA